MAGEFVEFLSNFEFEIRPFEKYQFNEIIHAELVKMVHNNIGFEWKMNIKAGSKDIDGREWRNNLGAFLYYQRGLHQKLENVEFSVFVEDGDVSGRQRAVNSFSRQGFGNGNRELVDISVKDAFGNLKVKGIIQEHADEPGNYTMTLAAFVRIREEYFKWEKVMERKKEEIPESTMNVHEFFKGIAVTSSPRERPASDTIQVLDFQIETNDGFTIWCHKVVLSQNHHFFQVMTAEFKEAKENLVEMEFEKEVMMEILHFVYNGRVSTNFPTARNNLIDVSKAAHYFHLKELKLHCEEKLIKKLGDRDLNFAVEVFIVADRYGMDVLREMALNLTSGNIWKVKGSGNFQYLGEVLWNEILNTNEKRGRVVKIPQSYSQICSD